MNNWPMTILGLMSIQHIAATASFKLPQLHGTGFLKHHRQQFGTTLLPTRLIGDFDVA